METIKFVLEKCGTEVDDDEVLTKVSGEVFLLLVDGETYTPSVPQQNPDTRGDVLGASAAEEVLQPNGSCSGTEMASSSASDPEASHKSSNALCTYVMCLLLFE